MKTVRLTYLLTAVYMAGTAVAAFSQCKVGSFTPLHTLSTYHILVGSIRIMSKTCRFLLPQVLH
jgi:hypothetical protein